ncbi:MAG: VWA domain-containing protein [Phycisphaerae bacterium]|nr:VWA domain-containing protein [Phycisphaerae bacterium]
MTWHNPSIWFLLLLLPVPLIAWWRFARRRRAIRFSSTALAGALPSTLKGRMLWLLPVLRIGAIVLLIVALARPQKGNEHTRIFSEGIAIEMLVDRSGSMRAMDFKLGGQPVNRLTAVKDVAAKFVRGDKKDKTLKGRDHDLVGMISFARFADNASPLTLDHDYLVDKLNKTQIAAARNEDGTAIGDAIGLGIERLESLKARRRKDADGKIKSKIIILLTDGENNCGDLDPLQAAELAKAMGIRIYTIGVGTRGRAPVPVTNPFTGREQLQWVQVSIDENTLKKIAGATSGKYFRATDTDSLRKIYAQINKLEKTKIEERRFGDYKELALRPFRLGPLTVPPLLLIAFLMLACECALANTWLRKLP